jgi:hypothetical protein
MAQRRVGHWVTDLPHSSSKQHERPEEMISNVFDPSDGRGEGEKEVVFLTGPPLHSFLSARFIRSARHEDDGG